MGEANPFIKAARDNSLTTVQSLIDKTNVNSQDADGRTALWHAAGAAYLDIVRFLVAREDVDVNLASNDGTSPLIHAAIKGHDAVVAVLLSHGADVNQVDNNGKKAIDVADNQKINDMLIAHTNKQQQPQQSPPGQAPSNGQAVPKMMDESQWFKAAKDGDLAVFQQGINDKIDVNCRDRNGCTAVYLTAREGHLQLLEHLITQHADLSIADNTGWSPLNIAAYNGKDAVVTVLLSYGADVNQANNDDYSPLHQAARYGYDAIVAVLLSHGADVNQVNNIGQSPLSMAAENGKDAMVVTLLSHGADINQANINCWSPLYAAAYYGKDAMVAVLLSHGADVNQAGAFGTTPIDVAKNQNIKDLLIAHTNKQQQPSLGQAVPKMMDESQWFKAAKDGDLAVIQQGINDKIDVNCRDSGGRTAMWGAALNGHLQLVEYLITQHADLSIAHNNGKSPLWVAACERKQAVVAALLSHEADVNQADKKGWSPLHIAVGNGCDAVVTTLLSHGADVNQADKKGEFPLHTAAYMRRDAMVAALLSHGADINQTNNNGESPLHRAVRNDNNSMVPILLSHGADVNQADKDGKKPIDVGKTQKIKDMLYDHMKKKQQDEQQPVDESLWFGAAERGDLAVIQQGINDKIDVNCRDSTSRTALSLAAEKGHVQLVEYLISERADLSIANTLGSSPLHLAALNGHEAVVTVLLSHGAIVNHADTNGISPLHRSAIGGYAAVVNVLLSNGADVNHLDKKGCSPLHQAVDNGHDAVVTVLLSHGANVNLANNDGYSPLISAAQKGHSAVVTVLLSHGAAVNQASNGGYSPLHRAVYHNHSAVITLLLANGADINKTDNDGEKPIELTWREEIKELFESHPGWFQAATKGDLAVIQQGINDKIDVNCRDINGRTAVYRAAEKGHLSVVEFLLSQHADLSIANDVGASPLHCAASNGHDAVVTALLSNGADVNQSNKGGKKPIDVGKTQEIKDMLYTVMKKKQQGEEQPVDESLWFGAAERGDLAVIQQGINDKIDVNCRDSTSRTALFLAAEKGHVQLVEYLISERADLSITNNYDSSPLHQASKEGHGAVVAALLSHGADVNHADKRGKKPIDVGKTQEIKDMLYAHRKKKQQEEQQSVDESLWFQAAEIGDLAVIQQGINDKIDVNCRDSTSRTALSLAAEKGHVQLVEYLITQLADLSIANNSGTSPLFQAAKEGHHDVVKVLLSHGANYNQANTSKEKPIDVAKTQEIKDMLYDLMKKKQQDEQQPVDKSLWFGAAERGDLAVIQQGINDKIDVNCRDGRHLTAMHRAAVKGHFQLVEYLLTQHADIPTNTGWSLLHIAAFYGHDDMAKMLVSNGADVNKVTNEGETPLFFATRHKESVATLLLSKGANANQVTNKGLSPLTIAGEFGSEAVVIALVDHGADVNYAGSTGSTTSLWWAASKGKEAVVKVLLSKGANVNLANAKGETPLLRAAANGHDAVVSVLLSNGADINQANNDGYSPLQQAAGNGHDAVVSVLLSNGAIVDQTDQKGETALHQAASKQPHLVSTLLDHGAAVNQIDNDGKTPLFWSAFKGHEEAVRLLLSKGADANQADKERKRPIDVAKTQEIKDILRPHTTQQQPEEVQPPNPSSAPVEAVNEMPDQNMSQDVIEPGNESQSQGLDYPEMAADGDDDVMMLLVDEIIADCVEEDLPTILMQLALEKGEKAWSRSTVIFVGAGRAGKTGTERSMLGYAFEHTDSTVGINNEFLFEVTSELANVDGDANFASGSRWLLAKKAEKEYESALAKLASAIQQGKVDKELEQKVLEQEAKLQALMRELDGENVVDEEAYVVAPSSSEPSMSFPSTAQAAVPSPTVIVSPVSNAVSASGGGGNSLVDSAKENPLVPLTSAAPPDVDLEYALRMLAKDMQMNSKLLLTFLDFGGQKAFESINQFFMVEQAVYVVVFNMECFLTPDRIPINPEKGITTWSECLKVAMHWLSTVVVHTMKAGSTTPSPIFIVGTHKDTVPSSADHQAISKALSAALGEYNPVLNSLQRNEVDGLCFFPIDNTLGRSDPVMTTLMKCIEEVTETQPHVQKMLPLMWFRVLDWMNGQSRFYLMYDEVAKYAKDFGFDMSTTQAVDDMLSMFHECSVLMWHNAEGLRHIVILNPIRFFVSHATNILRQHTGTATDATQHKLPKSIENKIKTDTFLRTDFSQMITTGIVTRRLLDVLLSESEEPQVVMQLMITYALLVPLVREEGDLDADGGRLKYLVPALLPEGTNEAADQTDGHRFVVFFSVTDAISDDCMRHGDMRDRGFLPGGLFSRLVAKLLVWSQETTTTTACTWKCDKDSVTLFFGAQKFLVTHRPGINAIQVSMFDRHTPLAIHARLDSILEVLKAECFKTLNMATFVEHSGDAPMQGAVRPSSGIRWMVPLTAIRKNAVFLGGGSQGVRRLTAVEVENGFGPWFVRTGASDVEWYDLFFSHRWDWNDKLFVRKLVDLLAQFTTGDNPPRAIISFLDIHSLEMGLNFQEAFVGALVRARAMVVVVSWAALARMMTHDDKKNETTILTKEDNVLVEWLCALRLLHLKRIHVMPVFFGKRTDANGVSGSFFEVDAATGTSILQRLPDIVAEPTVTMAVELMTKASVWTSGSPIEPSAFGLSSLSVRAIVTAMTSLMGVQACESKNPKELLRSCAIQITGILEKSTIAAGGGVGGGGSTVSSPTGKESVVVEVDYDKAWSIITDPRRVLTDKFDELRVFLEGQGFVEGSDLEAFCSDEEVMTTISGYLNPVGLKLFVKAMGM